MFKKIMANIFAEPEEERNSVVNYMVNLSEADYRNMSDAIKLYRKGEAIREEYYAKARAKLEGEMGDSEIDRVEAGLLYEFAPQKIDPIGGNDNDRQD